MNSSYWYIITSIYLQEQSAKKKCWPIISSNNNIHCSILVDIIQATPGRWGARDDRLPEFGSFLVVTNYIGAGVNGYNLHHPITSQVSCCDLWIRNQTFISLVITYWEFISTVIHQTPIFVCPIVQLMHFIIKAF